MTWFQRLLLVTIAATFILVVIGGTVRATDSGLGCPDWPACNGSLIPKMEKHTLIEYSHRTAASIVGVLFLGVTFFAFKTERKRPLVFWLAFSAGALLLAQIILGGVTVKKELPAGIVAAHLAVAMAFMGVMITTATISLMRSAGRTAVAGATDTAFTRMVALAAATAFATLVLGSYISGTDASLACSGWPLCNGSLIPGGDSAVGLHFLHRLLAGLLGILLLGATYLAFVEGRPKRMRSLMLIACAVYAVQAIVGAANIWTELSADVVVTHLSLAALLWSMLVGLSVASFYMAGEAEANVSPATRGKATSWAR